ncbi:MAG: hypothetical protein LBP39_00195 [Rickettsiales bacterium]|jgi:pantetheine-phosphate adenylyltransferase|nr:hypothetical protein [Rickettsiales bacterium]
MATKIAIITTSANPLHFGHLYLYQEAVKIFGRENVKIAVGRSRNKNIDMGRIIYHLKPYRTSYDIRENVTLAEYCRENNVDYIVRGIRNSSDIEYELKLDYAAREAQPTARTIFFPAENKFSNISSSIINKLLNSGEFNAAKGYMNEDSMYRFFYGSPEFIVFFGKPHIGKTNYLKNILKYGSYVVEVDEIFWKIFEKCFGQEEILKISSKITKLGYQGKKSDRLISAYLTDDFWKLFFDYIRANFLKINFSLEGLGITKEVFILDFPAIGNYWDTLDASLRSRFYLVKLYNGANSRRKFAMRHDISNRRNYMDLKYREPEYFDIEKNIDE